MRILFTTPILEHPAAGGPQLRIENSIKALSRLFQLDIVYRAAENPPSLELTGAYYSGFAGEYHVLHRAAYKGRFSKQREFLEKLSNLLFQTRITDQGRFVIDHVERRNIKIIWFGYGNISFSLIKYIKKNKPDLKIICDTDSVWSRFILRELPYAKGIRKLLIWLRGNIKAREEHAWVQLCEITTAVSEVDAEYYRGIAEAPGKVHIFSNVIDLNSYTTPPSPPKAFIRPAIYLAGSFGHYHSPMDTAARWVLEAVLPRVLAVRPDVHLYIVGRNSEIGFGNLGNPSVTATGKLDSVLPFLCNSSVALVPLFFESGTRFKILEAGACAVPLVSTTLGAEGIPVVDGEHLLIADTPEDFANAILKLLDDAPLSQKLADNCRRLVEEQFSIDSLTTEGRLLFETLDHA